MIDEKFPEKEKGTHKKSDASLLEMIVALL